MKRIITSLSILAVVLMTVPVQAQQWVIGSGTASNASTAYPTPYGAYYSGMRAQYIYRASELLAAGMTAGIIHELAFNVVALQGAGSHLDYSISMKNTTSTALTTYETGLTQVFSTGAYPPVTGWNTHALTTAFSWNGTSNIVVEVCFWNGQFNYTSNAAVQWTTGLPANSSINYRADTGGPFCTSTLTTAITTTTRPNIRFTRLVSCAAPPTAGSITGPSNICPNVAFTLTLTGYTFGSGITIQWQSSPNPTGGPWTNLGAAGVSPTYTSPGITAPTYYQAIVTCTNPGGGSTTTATKSITVNSFMSCYCTSSATSTADEEILNVTLNTLNNTTACGSGNNMYADFTNLPATELKTNSTYLLSLTLGSCGGNYGRSAKVFIDYNRDGVFSDPSEVVMTATYPFSTPNPTFPTANITVPGGAQLGITRMRVVYVETTVLTGVMPCGTYTWGETEDYYVNLKYGPPPPTVASNGGTMNATGDTTSICRGNTLTLTASGSTSGASYAWFGPTGFISTTGGVLTLNNIQMPQAGTYKAFAIVGSDTSAATNHTVVVKEGPNPPVGITDTVCLGDDAILTINAATGDTKWYAVAMGGTVTSTTDTMIVPNVTANTTYYAVKVGTNGCESAPRTPVVAALGAAPVVNLGSDTSFCETIPLILDAENPGAKYFWSTGATTQTISVDKVSGNYWVVVDRYCQRSDSVQVSIDLLPYANGISYLRNINTYIFSPADDRDADSYLWIFGDGNTDTGRTVNHTYADGSVYQVKLVMNNHCGDDTVLLLIPTALKNTNKNEDAVTLYPNPAENNITIEAKGNATFTALQVVNSVGAMVISENSIEGARTQKYNVDVTNLPSGYYIIRIMTTDGVYNKPFKVMH